MKLMLIALGITGVAAGALLRPRAEGGSHQRGRRSSALLGTGIIVAVGGLYASIGTPNLRSAMSSRAADYQAMIEENPNDVQAYLGKARTYMQMRSFQDARQAYEGAVSIAPKAPVIYGEYVSAMKFAGIKVAPKTPEQMLMFMPEADRKTAIESMVSGLAARLSQEGGTAEEWQMLARSYEVLGETEKATEAFKNSLKDSAAQSEN